MIKQTNEPSGGRRIQSQIVRDLLCFVQANFYKFYIIKPRPSILNVTNAPTSPDSGEWCALLLLPEFRQPFLESPLLKIHVQHAKTLRVRNLLNT